MISKRKSNISCDKECFDKAAPVYNDALNPFMTEAVLI